MRFRDAQGTSSCLVPLGGQEIQTPRPPSRARSASGVPVLACAEDVDLSNHHLANPVDASHADDSFAIDSASFKTL
eukprot:9201806-Pyramimonas_sp.AAC.1